MTEVHPKRPSTILETELKARGIHPRRLWEMRGPKDTDITWMHALMLDRGIVIVQTFSYGGWDAYTALNDSQISATVDDVIARCGGVKLND